MSVPASGPFHIDRLLRLLIDQAQEHAVFLTDPAGTVIWHSLGARRLFSLREGEGIGEKLEFIFTPEDRAANIADLERTTAQSDAIAEDDRWHLRRDGSRFWSSGAMVAIRDERGALVGFGKLIRDRTDMKEQIESLRSEVTLARAESERRDVAIAKLAHELRNVYAGLHMGLRMLGRDRVQEQGHVATLMNEQLHIIERLTEDVLDAQRLHGEGVSLALSPITLQTVLGNVCAQLQDRSVQKQVALHLLLPSSPIIVCADEVRLHQVFVNLLDNAIKYTPAGGRIWIKGTFDESEAVVILEDTGRGIAPDMLTRIFGLFTQVDTNVSGGGLGVGLALVRELVRLHHGTVQASSKGLGMGSEFTVRLPLYREGDRRPVAD